ncbi:MAG: hypothetical protein U0269_00325 [Polyangiales bacterium]
MLPVRSRNRLALTLALALTPSIAAAQLDPRATAARRALIEDAQRARRAGDHTQALTLATRAFEIQASPTLRRFLAEELLQNRRFADAAGMAELCESDMRAQTASRDRAEHIAACQSVRREASTHTARLLLRFEPPLPPDATVTVNDGAVAPALWGVPALVDEGSAVIEVRHPRFQVVQRQVTIGAGTTVEVAITLEPVAAQTVSTPTPRETEPARRPPLDRQTPDPRPIDPPRARAPQVLTSMSPLLPTGAALGGLGIATSVALYVAAASVAGEFDRACFANGVAMPGDICGARFQRDQDTIDALQWGSVAGIGLAAVGATLAIVGALSPSRRVVVATTQPPVVVATTQPPVVVAATARQLVIGGAF